MSMGFVLIFATVFSFARCCSQTCKDVNYELIISFVSLSLSRPHQLHLSLRANQRLRSLCRRSRRQRLRRRGSLQSLSKQRPFAFGGRTSGPELYDDGLTEVERMYIERGAKQALTGAAKLRFTFLKQGGKGY